MNRSQALVGLALGLLVTLSAPMAEPALGTTDDRYGDRPARSGAQHWLGTTHDADKRRDGGDQNPAAHYGEPRRYERPDYRYDRDARRAADAVRRGERGRVLSSRPDEDRGYRVRVLTPDGYVRERYVDPRDADDTDMRRSHGRD